MVIDCLFILIPKLFHDGVNITNLTKNKSNKPNKKRRIIMEKEEILLKAQKENKGVDLAERKVVKDATWIAYFVIVWLVIIVDLVNGFVLHNVNRGMDFVLFSAAFVVFLIKYIKLRRKHELVVMLIWALASISMLTVWILQLSKVI